MMTRAPMVNIHCHSTHPIELPDSKYGTTCHMAHTNPKIRPEDKAVNLFSNKSVANPDQPISSPKADTKKTRKNMTAVSIIWVENSKLGIEGLTRLMIK